MHTACVQPLTLAAFLVLALSASASAQSTSGRLQLFGAAAAHTLWDEESFIGTGVSAGAGLGFQFIESLTLRGRVVRSRNERDFGTGVVFERLATRYTAELIRRLSRGAYAPYLGGAVGMFAYDHRSTFGPDPRDPRRPVTPVQRFTSSGHEWIGGGIGGFTAVRTGTIRLQPEASMWLTDGYHIVLEVGVVAALSW
jgi:hypothetical protein